MILRTIGKNTIALFAVKEFPIHAWLILACANPVLKRYGVNKMEKPKRFFVSPSGEWFALDDLHSIMAKELVEKYYPEAGNVDNVAYLLTHGWKKSYEGSNQETYLYCFDVESPKEDFTLTEQQYLALKEFFGDKVVWKRCFIDPTSTEELTLDEIYFNYKEEE